MKIRKSMKAVALLLLLACVFTLLAGCGTHAAPTAPTDTNPTEPSEPEWVLPNGLYAFAAFPFADFGAFNWQYSLNVRVVEDRVYLNDVLYREIPSEGFKISNANKLCICWVEGKDTKDFLEKLNSSKMHCLLETETESHYGKQIAVYDIDGTLYFVSFYDNNKPVRVHYRDYTTEG